LCKSWKGQQECMGPRARKNTLHNLFNMMTCSYCTLVDYSLYLVYLHTPLL
jgi:hypothetical protein